MNAERLKRLEKWLNRERIVIPSALIRYGDGRKITAMGYYEGCTAALAGDVVHIDGDDTDFCNLLKSLSGQI